MHQLLRIWIPLYSQSGQKKKKTSLAIKHIIWHRHDYQNIRWVKMSVHLKEDGCKQQIGHRGSRLQGLQDAIKHPRACCYKYKLPGYRLFWFHLLVCPQHSEQRVAPRRHSVTICWKKGTNSWSWSTREQGFSKCSP